MSPCARLLPAKLCSPGSSVWDQEEVTRAVPMPPALTSTSRPGQPLPPLASSTRTATCLRRPRQDWAGNVSSPQQAQCQFQALLGREEAQGGTARVNTPVSVGTDWFGTCGPGFSPQAQGSASPGSPRLLAPSPPPPSGSQASAGQNHFPPKTRPAPRELRP